MRILAPRRFFAVPHVSLSTARRVRVVAINWVKHVPKRFGISWGGIRLTSAARAASCAVSGAGR